MSRYLGGCVDCIYESKDKDEAGRLLGIEQAVTTVTTKNGKRDVCFRHSDFHERLARDRADAKRDG